MIMVLLGYFYGITNMLIGMIGSSILIYSTILFLTSYMIRYSVKEQLMDILPAFIMALLIAIPVFIFGHFMVIAYLAKLILQLLLGNILFILFGLIIKNQEFLLIKSYIINKINKKEINYILP